VEVVGQCKIIPSSNRKKNKCGFTKVAYCRGAFSTKMKKKD
jgi:hypothetical protein